MDDMTLIAKVPNILLTMFHMEHGRMPNCGNEAQIILQKTARLSPSGITEAGWCSMGWYPPIPPEPQHLPE